MNKYILNAGLMFSISHLFIFATTSLSNILISLLSFGLCIFSIFLSSKQPSQYLRYFQQTEAPLVITGIAMLFQSSISVFLGFIPQAIIGYGYAAGNIIKAFELTHEKKGTEFFGHSKFYRTIFRAEWMHTVANIALAYFSSSAGLWCLPLLFSSLIISFLPHWRGQKINYAWSRALLSIYYICLTFFALYAGNYMAVGANIFALLGSIIIMTKMNDNFKLINNKSKGLSLASAIW